MGSMPATILNDPEPMEAAAGVSALVEPPAARATSTSTFTLAAAVVGFFVITLDAVVVNVALPSIRRGLGGGISGLQWVVDG